MMIVSILTAAVVCGSLMPILIQVGLNKGMYALGGENRQELRKIPVLGGVGIYFGILVSVILAPDAPVF